MTVVIPRFLIALFVTGLLATLGACLFVSTAFALVAETPATATNTPAAEPQTTADPQQEARTNTQADRAQLQAELTTSTAEKRIQMQEQAAQRKATLETRAQERVTNLSANMSNRMDSVIVRLQNITDRLQSRLTKLNEAGVNTTDSAAALAAAQLSLDGAQAEISDIDVAVYRAVSSEDIHSGWISLKTKFTTIGNSIKTAHSQIRSSISLAKEATLESRAQQSAAASNQ